jgi:hypothetical protein
MHLQHFPEADAAIPLYNTLPKRDTVSDAFLHIKDYSIPRITHYSTSETITVPQSPITNTLTTSFPQKNTSASIKHHVRHTLHPRGYAIPRCRHGSTNHR